VSDARQPDFAATAADYGRYRAGFPESIFDRLAEYGVGRGGQAIVDLGTGTGSLARGFAMRACHVVALDHGLPLLIEALRIDQEVGVEVDYLQARAEHISLAGHAADVVTAGQCWHWFDRSLVVPEIVRLLKPGGRLVIAHFDWLPLPGSVVAATERLILAHNPTWGMADQCGIYPQWFRELGHAGFHGIESFSYDVDVPYSHEAWRGRVRTCGGVGAAMQPEQVERFDRALAALLAERFPAAILHTPHRVFAVLARPPR
jgi:SAM-dependent methyltransferase